MQALLSRLRFAILLLFPLSAFAQFPTPVVEYTVHYGDYGDGVDLTGYVTFDVYLEFDPADPNPWLTTLFGGQDVGPEWIVAVEADCPAFQHDQGGPTVEDIPCFLLDFFPSLEWDSYFTIGNSCKGATDAQLFTVTTDAPALDAWENTAVPGNYFDGGANMTLLNTAFFRLPTDPLCAPDANNRILIGRFTNQCGICLTFGEQYFPNYTGPGSAFQTTLENACFENPCIANAMDVTPDITSGGCFGDPLTLDLDASGNGPVDYTLFSGNTVGSGTLVNTFTDQNGLTITTIDPGDYYISMIDEVGCRDTTAVFTIEEILPIEFSAELLSGVLCAGEENASIEITCSGGTGTLDVSVNGTAGYTCGEVLADLPCGDYDIIATDDNGCTADTTIVVVCPTELVADLASTSIPCYNYDNGTITGSVTGGTGTITVVLSLGGGDLETLTGTGSVAVNFDALDQGIYTVTWTDENNCGGSEDFEITEPEEFSAVATTTDATCFGFCDGVVSLEITGGTAPFTTTVTSEDGEEFAEDELCAGLYEWEIVDGNGCIVSDSILINQLPDITYSLSTTDETCFNFCDGTILIEGVAGGFSTNYTYTLSPNSGLCTDPCSGTSAEYTALCDGTYTVTIADDLGCEKEIPSITIDGPEEVVLTLQPTNVTCNGYANGMVEITAEGGTGDVTLVPENLVLPATITDLAPGTYTYNAEDENGCPATADVIITEPDSLIATLTGTTNPTCGGACNGTATYAVTGGTLPYNYLLLPTGQSGAVNNILGALCAQEYQLIVGDLNNCADTLDFIINEPPPLFIDALINSPTCTGMFDGSAIIVVGGGTGAVTTIFDPDDMDIVPQNDTTFNIANIGEGTFLIEIYDENECSLQETITVIPDIITDMVLTTYSSPETCWNEMDGTATIAVQNGNPPISYEWDDPDMQVTATATGLMGSETYTVIVTDVIGCTLSAEVTVDPTVGCFFISTGLTPNGDGVNDIWLLGGLEFFPDAKIQVFNRWGQEVFESRGYSAPWDGTYKGEALPTADYYFIIDYSKEFEPITGTVTIKY